MVTRVLKRNKGKQRFMPSKIRRAVNNAAKDAKLSSKRRNQLVLDVAEPMIELVRKKRLVKAVDLRRSLLGRLDRRLKKVPKEWRKFDRKKRA